MIGLFVKFFKNMESVKIKKFQIDITFGNFLNDNFQLIVTFKNTNLIDLKAFKKAKLFLSNDRDNLEKQLLFINVFREILEAITYLEKQKIL